VPDKTKEKKLKNPPWQFARIWCEAEQRKKSISSCDTHWKAGRLPGILG